jgi:hypothetical protein
VLQADAEAAKPAAAAPDYSVGESDGDGV